MYNLIGLTTMLGGKGQKTMKTSNIIKIIHEKDSFIEYEVI